MTNVMTDGYPMPGLYINTGYSLTQDIAPRLCGARETLCQSGGAGCGAGRQAGRAGSLPWSVTWLIIGIEVACY